MATRQKRADKGGLGQARFDSAQAGAQSKTEFEATMPGCHTTAISGMPGVPALLAPLAAGSVVSCFTECGDLLPAALACRHHQRAQTFTRAGSWHLQWVPALPQHPQHPLSSELLLQRQELCLGVLQPQSCRSLGQQDPCQLPITGWVQAGPVFPHSQRGLSLAFFCHEWGVCCGHVYAGWCQGWCPAELSITPRAQIPRTPSPLSSGL